MSGIDAVQNISRGKQEVLLNTSTDDKVYVFKNEVLLSTNMFMLGLIYFASLCLFIMSGVLASFNSRCIFRRSGKSSVLFHLLPIIFVPDAHTQN